ncbi:Transmembrane protein [Cupriavidus necator]|uniref:Transmembrane protein n=1 Tax=Cupriavidus necator (strain ATCC 17699 / DSM 428 / KCTC 22496 / NCIMB 10442 / H16 / Stanier 337) TaxID=381666 RepID=Q0K598_CUPNH|nr:membrane protein [Cupriavidus necator]QCC02774.1 hypothetical protein E6A55_19210 [Cupriavidus necator H16]QQB79826.1 hypothetical protein I6H87_31840 [Cupriavidus necator]WKA44075.1 hypothetical protein QWP09_19235 [Cupriavidus necator]CAJ94826.1 Transmembrane protein [Cupriavidus necator H16]
MRLSWVLIVHIGGASLTFPLAAMIALRLVYLGFWRQACYWLLSLGAGVAVILAGKLAFEIGGWSIPSANVYSISGHAMLTASVYPVLCAMLGSTWGRRTARFGLFAGVWVAVVVAVALIVGRYHTLAETLIGMAVGLTVAWLNLHPFRPLARAGQTPMLARLALCGFLVLIMPAALHPIKTRLWSHGLLWFGVTERYFRSIDTDPVSGRTVVNVEQCRLPSYRACSDTF